MVIDGCKVILIVWRWMQGGHLQRLTLETRPRIPVTVLPLCPPQAMELLQTTHINRKKRRTEQSKRPQKCKKRLKKIINLNLNCVMQLTGDVRYSLFRCGRPVLLFRSTV